jgi:putative peptide zinc metalloprotease protein
MATVLDQPASSMARPVALRMRRDLILSPQMIAGRRYWAIKDPVAMSFFRLRDEELAVLEMLDGQTSSAEIIARFARRFAPRRLTPERLHAFVAKLHRDGLVVSSTPGQGRQMLVRACAGRRRRWLMSFANPLAIRLPGVNPSPLLDRLYPLARWFFSKTTVALGVGLIAAAFLLVTTKFAQFEARLPDLQSYFTSRNAVVLLVAVSFVKVLHELGHALACRHFGGECHEVGPMLLMFAPCLYCDVSDSWMFDSRWRRMAVAAAGIYVEAVLAAVATFVWWSSEPRLASALAVDVMFVCSVGTLLFNGNPLLRYDGYYALSDLVEIPNLAEQSTASLRALLARLVLGARSPDQANLARWRHVFLIVYAVASTAYRWALIALLLWFCYRVLLPYRLEALAAVLAAIVVAGLLGSPVTRVLRFASAPSSGAKAPRGRLIVAAAMAFALVAIATLLPLPVRVAAPVVIEPQYARRVYVSEPGTLAFSVRAGQAVQAGETLAVLGDSDLALEITRLQGDRDRQRLRLENLERRRGQDRTAAAEIPTARQALADLDERLSTRQADRDRLPLKAPIAGTVLPPAWKDQPHVAGVLPEWQGTPLLPQNQGAFLQTGTLFCLVGDPHSTEAVAIVDQSDVERVAVGQRAEVKLDQRAGPVLWGTVTEIAEIDVDVAPRQLAYNGELPVRKDDSGLARPLSASYQVRIELDAGDHRLLMGAPGRVRIHAPGESLAGRLRRWLRGTFHFVT